MKLININRLKKNIFLRTFIGLGVITVFLIVTLTFPLTNDLKEKNNKEIHFIVDAKLTSVNQFLSKIVNIAEQFTSRTQIRKKLEAYNQNKISQKELFEFSHNKLLDAMKKSKDAYGITRLDKNGEIVVVVGKQVPDFFFKNFNKDLNKTTIFNPVMIDNNLSIIIATPILNRKEQRVGIDIVLFKTDSLESIIKDYNGMGETGETLITYSKDGEKYQSVFQPRKTRDLNVISLIVHDFKNDIFKSTNSYHDACEHCVTTIRAIDKTDWFLLFKIDKEELTSLIHDNTIRLIIIALIIFIAGLYGIYLLTAPLIKNLEDDIQEIGKVQKELKDLNADLENKIEEAIEKNKEQEELMIAQSRHAAMGEMISMIAHQWRQPIAAISMGANNIILDIQLDDIKKENFDDMAHDILDQTQYLTKTIDDFSNFFKPNKEKNEINPKDIIEESLSIIGKSIENNGITIERKLHETCEIKTYSRELLQVIINILKNAKEAFAKSNVKEKKIVIELKENEDIISITIADNAGGVPEEIKEKIFDPYFSTKKERNGTGLGLYMSKTIVNKHLYGELYLQDNSQGAVFKIELPKG